MAGVGETQQDVRNHHLAPILKVIKKKDLSLGYWYKVTGYSVKTKLKVFRELLNICCISTCSLLTESGLNIVHTCCLEAESDSGK